MAVSEFFILLNRNFSSQILGLHGDKQKFRFSGQALIINESFDTPHISAQINPPAEVIKQGGFNGKGMLKVVGTKQVNQYPAFLKPVTVKPGTKYGVSCNFKTEGTVLGGSILVMIFFNDANGKATGEGKIVLQPTSTWEYVCSTITAPAKTKSMKIAFRLVNVPSSETVYFSNVKLADLSVNKDFFLTEFEVGFEPTWNKKLKAFKNFSFASGTKILNDWRQAKTGEACFVAIGNNEPMQYPLWIRRIKVGGGMSYVFEADYKSSKGIASNSNAMFLLLFRGADNKLLSSVYVFVAGSNEKWKHAKEVMVAPKGSVFLDICLNLRKIAQPDNLSLDNLRFYSEGSRSFLKFLINPDSKKLTASCSATSNIKPEDIKSSSIIISKDNVKKCCLTPLLEKEAETDITEWEDGKYSIFSQIETKSGEKLKSNIETFYVFNKTPWLNNKIGLLANSAAPPTPWTKISCKNSRIETWNNQIKFSNDFQLKSISYTNDKFELLSSPMQFLVNGENIFANKSESPVASQTTPSEVSFSGYIKCDGFDLKINTKTDYTGFVKYDLSLNATRDIKLEQAQILLSVNGVEFLNHANGSWTHSRAFDLAKDKNWKASRFYPAIWVGGMKHGLYWFSEKLYPATEIMPKDWVFADANGKLAIDMVNKPLQLKAGEKYSIVFGIGVTPTRPNKKLWKKLRFRGGKFSNFDNLWASPQYFKHYGFPEASGERAVLMKKYVEANPQVKKIFYQCPTYIATNLPQWSFFKQAWKAEPASGYKNIEGLDYDLIKGNYIKQTWRDFYLANFINFIRKYKFDGVYHDCAGLDILLDGKNLIYPVFTLRNFLKRIYIIQRHLNPESFTVSHVGANFSCPSVAFSDIILMGEHYRQGCFDKDFYLEFIPLRLFRAENAIDIGPDRMFMFQYQQTDKQQRKDIALHAMGLVMTHNLMVYPGFINQQIVDRVRNLRYGFGMTDADFFPYWEENHYGIKTDNPHVICSFYKNSKGFLISLLNSTGKEQTFKIKTNKTEVISSKATMYEPLIDKKSKINFKSSIKLKPYMATFLLIEK